ncbi:MAG: hypothetical protein CM15mP23_08900 [Cryomorphaceae bacterium]|nr:MAG: hypothetical protein CM15mP23_08900 [Cryomorphaceae bacterium]
MVTTKYNPNATVNDYDLCLTILFTDVQTAAQIFNENATLMMILVLLGEGVLMFENNFNFRCRFSCGH